MPNDAREYVPNMIAVVTICEVFFTNGDFDTSDKLKRQYSPPATRSTR